MRKANLKRKPNSTMCAVIEPPPSSPRGIDLATGEVIGFQMQHQSQTNIDSWWDVFREIATECPDWKRHRRRRNR